MKSLIILGSTGSIGKQALEIVRQHPHEFSVKALSCHSNVTLLKEQIREFRPEAVAVADREAAEKISGAEVFTGEQGLIRLAKLQGADIVLNALVGSAGVRPTEAALLAKNTIALANKETLVAAGEPIMRLAEKQGTAVIPVDSEHSAIFQCLLGEQRPSSLTLTCSGGPFRGKTAEELKQVCVKEALSHPNWSMGQKISIDSATLMNKGLEVIEAHHLFNLPYDSIKVLIHPESIVHSLVEFPDTSVKAQLGLPDMRVPIQYALSYPLRIPTNLKSLNLAEIGRLTFSPPDTESFPCLSLAYQAGKEGGSMPCVLNAANEAAVRLFLQGKIPFPRIPELIRGAMDSHASLNHPDIEELMDIDRKTKKSILA